MKLEPPPRGVAGPMLANSSLVIWPGWPQFLFSKLENHWCRGVEALARDRLRRQQQPTAW